jgi:hypothetical protein
MLELLRHQPIHVGWSPRRLARVTPPDPQHQRRDLLALALEVLLRRLTGAREVAHGLMPLVGHPHCGEFASPQQLGQFHRIAPIGLDPIAWFLRDQRGSHHHDLVAESLDQSVETVSRRPCLVAERQTLILRRKLGHELAHRCLRRRQLPDIAHLAATAAFGNGHGVAQLGRINPDESFAMMPPRLALLV